MKKTAQVGRPVTIPEAQFRKVYGKLLRKHQGKEVSVNMVKTRMKLTCSTKTASCVFWLHGICFRPLYKKPNLSTADVKARLEWAEAHRRRSSAQVDPRGH